MRSDLDHLPANKRRELERVVQLVFEEFEDAFALAKHEWKKKGRILKVILYGIVAATLAECHQAWLDQPGKFGQQRKDNDLRRFLPDYGHLKIGKYEAGWLDPYREAWPLLQAKASTL